MIALAVASVTLQVSILAALYRYEMRCRKR